MKTNLSGNAVYFSYITANQSLSNKALDSSFAIPETMPFHGRAKEALPAAGG